MTTCSTSTICYRAVSSRDGRFDGWFFTAVTTTGIYCRPSCPAMTPKRSNVRFYPSAAAAQGGGFRACRRCRPDASPGSPEWNVRADAVARAMRLIGDGVVDRDGVGGARAAARLQRAPPPPAARRRGRRRRPGARPRAARPDRAHPAGDHRPAGDQVAFASGFASVRQFNDTVRDVFATTPTGLRDRRRNRKGVEPGRVELRLAYREPCDVATTLSFLGLRAVPGVEEYDGTTYRRSLSLAHGQAVVALTPADGHVRADLRLDDVRDLSTAVARCRRLLDLDADPVAIAEALGSDPVLGRARAVRARAALPRSRRRRRDRRARRARPAGLGRRAPAALPRGSSRATASRSPRRSGSITHLFPSSATLADVDPTELPMPRARGRAVVGIAEALASGAVSLDPGADRDEVEARLLELPGIGPWTTAYLRMRALSDPDAFLPTDLGVRRGLEALGVAGDPTSARTLAEAWRPWRSYAVHHLWNNEETS